MFGFSPMEMMIVGVVAVLLFGSRLPSVARSAGKSLTEFRRGLNDLQQDFRESMRESETATATPAGDTQARLPHSGEVVHDDSASDASYDPAEPIAEEDLEDDPIESAEIDPDRDRREAGEPA